MNRQERRRTAREGGKKPAWDLIITAGVLVTLAVVFACIYLFPNLNLSSYESASPRVLRLIVNRGINWLEKDWPSVDKFAYGYYKSSEEWPSLTVTKGADKWQFAVAGATTTEEYAVGSLPSYYRSLEQALVDLKAALANDQFKLSWQQNTDGYNYVSLIRVVDKEKGLQEQYSLAFNESHQLDQLIYYNSTGAQPNGYSFVSLYTDTAATTTD